MARGIYFSGDLVGLNQAMDSEERNRIAGRTGNQAFLANLAGTTIGNATARRGQDSQERMFGMENESRERIAGRNADVASQGNRFNFDAAMARNATDRERIGAAFEEIRQRESEGLRVDERAKQALLAAATDNAAQRATMERIAQIQADATGSRLSPRGAEAMFEQNAAIDEFNIMAEAAANAANLKAREGKLWGYNDTASARSVNNAFLAMTPEQQAMVQIVDQTDATGKVVGKMFAPRKRTPIQMPGQTPRPGALIPGHEPVPNIFSPTNNVPVLNLTNTPATNRVIQVPRVVTPLSDIERGRRIPTNQVVAAEMPAFEGPVQNLMGVEDVLELMNQPQPARRVTAPMPVRMMGPEQTAALRGDPSLDGRLRRGYGSFSQAVREERPVFATPPIAQPQTNNYAQALMDLIQLDLLRPLTDAGEVMDPRVGSRVATNVPNLGNWITNRPVMQSGRSVSRFEDVAPMDSGGQLPALVPQMRTMDPRYAAQIGLPVQYRPQVRMVSGEPAADMRDRLMRGRNRFSDAIMR